MYRSWRQEENDKLNRATIYPLTTCPKCKGSGVNAAATAKLDSPGRVRCTLCNGEGKY
jgi:DnaJ-class molecular chaperone